MTQRTLLRWAPALGWIAVIFWQSSLSRVPGTQVGEAVAGPSFAPLAHVGEYFVLAVLLGIALRTATRGGWWWVGVFALVVVLGGLDEVHQAFVPGRVAALDDVAWDTLGASFALGAWWVWRATS